VSKAVELRQKFAGLAVSSITRLWMRTLDYQTAYYDPVVDAVVDRPSDRAYEARIFIFWHEYIPFQYYLRGNCNVAMLLSHNRDAEWLARANRHMGFHTIRGSSYRGALGALRRLLWEGQHMNLTITPDGPRGPRRRLSQGPVYLSSRLQIPLVAIGMGYDRPWRLPSWDRFAVPRPRSRARAIWSPDIRIPPQLDRRALESYRQRVETLLTRLTLEAEAWAEAGSPKIGQVPTRRQSLPRRLQCVRRPVEQPVGSSRCDAA
jgi:lysophospholipid acyltransferase (LPLAT)-like uncharacterized protein